MKHLQTGLSLLLLLLLLTKPGSGRSDRSDPPEGEEKSVKVLAEGRSANL